MLLSRNLLVSQKIPYIPCRRWNSFSEEFTAYRSNTCKCALCVSEDTDRVESGTDSTANDLMIVTFRRTLVEQYGLMT